MLCSRRGSDWISVQVTTWALGIQPYCWIWFLSYIVGSGMTAFAALSYCINPFLYSFQTVWQKDLIMMGWIRWICWVLKSVNILKGSQIIWHHMERSIQQNLVVREMMTYLCGCFWHAKQPPPISSYCIASSTVISKHTVHVLTKTCILTPTMSRSPEYNHWL